MSTDSYNTQSTLTLQIPPSSLTVVEEEFNEVIDRPEVESDDEGFKSTEPELNSTDSVLEGNVFNTQIGNEIDEDDEKTRKGSANVNRECYTHTVMLLGQCVVMCDKDILRLCG